MGAVVNTCKRALALKQNLRYTRDLSLHTLEQEHNSTTTNSGLR